MINHKDSEDYYSYMANKVNVMPKMNNIHWELGGDYSDKVHFSEFAIKSYNNAYGVEDQKLENEVIQKQIKELQELKPTLADCITLVSLGLGLWWAAGGPIWAGLLSILGDELDGRVARLTNTQSERGSLLDWGSDITLTTASLMRFGLNTGLTWTPIIAAPIFLHIQSHLRSKDWRPPVGSARAIIMLSTMAIGKR